MDRIQDFRELIVWQKAHQLFLDIVKDVESFPNTQASKIIIDQLLRSCGSISANIAEGFGRKKRERVSSLSDNCKRFNYRDTKLVDKMF